MSRLPDFLNDSEACRHWLLSIRVADTDRGLANLRSIFEKAAKPDFERLQSQIEVHLPTVSDPDRALNNLERFFAAHTGLDFSEFLEEGSVPKMSALLTLFSDSQFISDLLVRDRDCLRMFSSTNGAIASRDVLVADLQCRLNDARQSADAMKQIRRFKQQHTVRIAIGDLILAHRLEQVVKQISLLAEAVIEGTLWWALRRLREQWGIPLLSSGMPARYVVLALGKLGGAELNYSSDIDLLMIYDEDGDTDGSTPKTNREFFERLTRDVVRLLSESTTEGPAYRVDLRLRPEGSKGKICASLKSVTHYYDFRGRTWERQALIKAKPVAGSLELGKQLLERLYPWIYRLNLNRADIAGIKALKRRIERKAIVQGESETNIKTGRGGIRDIEFVIQFLQLLNGGVIAEVQTPNTLKAIKRLEIAGCLTTAESVLLTQNYRWLRTLEHRLHLMFDLQTHTLPPLPAELQKTALRMGSAGPNALQDFRTKLIETTGANRTILNHLLHGAFGNTYGSLRDSGGHLAFAGDQDVAAEVDLVLEPEPDQEMIDRVLGPYGFKFLQRAFENLMDLAKEKTPFLSPRRCHHFLAAIAPSLLREISHTPDPDATLVALSTVSDSLGAKGVLWELFSFNPPTLSLYVRMCATSDYLAGILKRNPGMIDELMDALQVEKLPSLQFLRENMIELVRGARDIEPIVYSFQHAHHLRVGIRDILGRDEIQDTHRTLSDVAQVCLATVAQHEFVKLAERHTDLENLEWNQLESICPFVILGLGKLGGREPNYHSDLDVIFLYGNNHEFESGLHNGISSQYFFSQLAANITQFITHSHRLGRLYELDCRLRPTGHSGPLAVSMEEFSRYFESGAGRLWERQSLCKARPVFGSPPFLPETARLVRQAILGEAWSPHMAREIADTRKKMELDCSECNLKRGIGGTVDVEFAIQALQLKHAQHDESVLVSGTLEAIRQLVLRGYLQPDSGNGLAENYQLLRGVEARLRLINTTARHDLPNSEMQLNKLAYLMNFASSTELIALVSNARRTIRQHYIDLIKELSKN